MERNFSSRWQDRAGAIFMILICICMIAFGLYTPHIRHFGPEEWWVPVAFVVMFGLLGGGLGAFMLWGLLESFTQYSADEMGITRKSVFKTQTMSWREVVSFTTSSSGRRATYRLTDNLGQKMTVYLNMAANAEALYATLEERLAPLREAQVKAIDANAFDQKPPKAQIVLGVFGLLFGAGFVAGSIYLLVDGPNHVTTRPNFAIWIIGGLGCAMGALFIGTALYLMTRRMTITHDEIAVSSVFGKKAVPFSQVASLISRDKTYKQGVFNVTTVKGANGVKIELMDTTPNYAALLQFIRERAGERALTQGEAELPQIQRKERRIGIIVMSIVLPILLGYLGWRAWGGIQELNRETALDRKSVTTQGVITESREVREDKAKQFQIAYRFDEAGRRYQGVTYVDTTQYQQTRNGDAATIQYLPGDPTVSRYVPSNGKRHAMVNLLFVGVYLLLIVGGLLFEGVRVFVKKRKAALAPGD